jgi:hypothetical protein
MGILSEEEILDPVPHAEELMDWEKRKAGLEMF